MSALAMTVSDTLVLARRNLMRIPRQPDLLVAYTVQPVMFVLLFVYVFGGAIETPGFDYVDFLMPGITATSIPFGGFVTALGLSEDVQKGLIDRFRSLPMSRGAVLAGRTFSDILLNCLSLVALFTVGFIAGFDFQGASVPEIALGIVLLLLLGYAFSWVFALIGLFSSSPETANSFGFTLIFPLTFASSMFVPAESMPDGLRARIEDALESMLGYDVSVFLRSADEIRAIAAQEPFSAGQVERSKGKLQVMMLNGKPTAGARKSMLALATDDDALAFGERELYWLPSGGMSDSNLDLKGIGQVLGTNTIRTKGTVEQMAARFFAE